MKRTSLKRKTPLMAKKPMSRVAPFKKKAAKRKSNESRWANDRYLAFVRGLPCCHCGVSPAGDAHHVIGVGNFSGVGLKAPDSLSMPLCRSCHGLVHATPDIWSSQWGWMLDTINRAKTDWSSAVRHGQHLDRAIKAIQDYHR